MPAFQKFLKGLPAALLLISGPAALSGTDIFRDQQASWRIVLPPNHSEPERFAAEELQKYILLSSGVKLPLKTEDPPSPATHAFHIGVVRSSGPLSGKVRFPSSSLTDEFAITAADGNIYIISSNPRSVLFGVYEFLKSELGIRWFWPGEKGEFVPKRESCRYNENLRIHKKAAFAYREMSLVFQQNHFDTQMWTVRNGLNQSVENFRLCGKTGAIRRYAKHSVGFPKKDFQQHGELFGVFEGKPSVNVPAGCWSNPAFLDLMLKKHLSLIERNQLELICPFPADAVRRCECAACVREANPSRRWYAFFEKLADGIRKVHPAVKLATIGYQEYRRYPGYRINGAEYVDYCQYNRCYVHKYGDPHCPLNRRALQELDAWIASGTPMGCYGYEFDIFSPVYYVPFWNMLADQARTLRARGLVRMKTEMPVQNADSKSGRHASTLERMRLPYYLFARLAWDPDLDVNAAIDDFCRTVYGCASSEMYQYHILMAEAWDSMKEHFTYFLRPPDSAAAAFLNQKTVEKANALLKQAERKLKKAGNSPSVVRQREDLALDAACFRDWEKLFHTCRRDAVSIPVAYAGDYRNISAVPMTFSGKTEEKQPELKLRRTENALHLLVRTFENDMKQCRKGKAGNDVQMWHDSHVELFLDCGSGAYYHFAANPAGGRYDAMGTDSSWNASWTAETKLLADGYEMEFVLPFKALNAAPETAEQFRLLAVFCASSGNRAGFPVAAFHDMSRSAVIYFSRKDKSGKRMIYLNFRNDAPALTRHFLADSWDTSFHGFEDAGKLDFSQADLILVCWNFASRNSIPFSVYRDRIEPAVRNGAVIYFNAYGAPALERFFGNPELKLKAKLNGLHALRRVTRITDSSVVTTPDDIRDLLKKKYTPAGVFTIPENGKWEFVACQKMQNGEEYPFLIVRRHGKGLIAVGINFIHSRFLNNLLEYRNAR